LLLRSGRVLFPQQIELRTGGAAGEGHHATRFQAQLRA